MEKLENAQRIDYNRIENPIIKQMFRKYDEYSQQGTLSNRGNICGYSKKGYTVYHKHGGGGGCYLTTACLEAMGIPQEESQELEAIKLVTKEHVLRSREGKRDYILYHRKAPRIVSKIESRADSRKIWERVYERLRDITQTISNGELERGYQCYKSLVIELDSQL